MEVVLKCIETFHTLWVVKSDHYPHLKGTAVTGFLPIVKCTNNGKDLPDLPIKNDNQRIGGFFIIPFKNSLWAKQKHVLSLGQGLHITLQNQNSCVGGLLSVWSICMQGLLPTILLSSHLIWRDSFKENKWLQPLSSFLLIIHCEWCCQYVTPGCQIYEVTVTTQYYSLYFTFFGKLLQSWDITLWSDAYKYNAKCFGEKNG